MARSADDVCSRGLGFHPGSSPRFAPAFTLHVAPAAAACDGHQLVGHSHSRAIVVLELAVDVRCPVWFDI